MRLLAVRERFPHMGKFSGYDVLFQRLQQMQGISLSTISRSPDHFRIPRLKKFYERKSQKIKHTMYFDSSSYESESLALLLFKLNMFDFLHYGYLENNLSDRYLKFKKKNKSIIATVHQPESWWYMHRQNPDIVSGLDKLIVLDSHSKTFFSQFLEPEKIHKVLHGVDTAFFKPGIEKDKEHFSCIFSGHWLRDISCLRKVITLTLSEKPDIIFHLVYPMEKRIAGDDIVFLSKLPQVKLYSGISDQELLGLYQKSHLMLLPLTDSTANNAVLEAMSSGLPVLSTKVGGVEEYCSADSGFLFKNEDAEGFVKAIINLYEDDSLLKKMSRNARDEAEKKLDWGIIVKESLKVYTS